MKEFLNFFNPFYDPEKRSVEGSLFWAFITGFGTYASIVDGIKGSNWWFALAALTFMGCIANLFFAFRKMKMNK